jgi:tRNA-dihydrouridine synthase A
MRLISKRTRLYTEMITTGALLYGDAPRFLAFHAAEQPVALQLGGCDPNALAQCAKLAEEYGYAEVNLNVGCPSDRVQAGKFGACLMAEPNLVADCISAMREACALPVTVKSRIGIDKQDNYEFLEKFIDTVALAGCEQFIIHARKAWLSGLSPKQNREIPPLSYATVYQIKRDFPALTIIINGGITTLEQATEQLNRVDGVMLGRAAYYNPYLFANVDQQFFNEATEILTRENIVEQMLFYIDTELTKGTKLHAITRHMLHLYNGLPGAKNWRRTLSHAALQSPQEGIKILQRFFQCSS